MNLQTDEAEGTSSQQAINSRWLEPAIIAALVPTLAVVYTYVYEWGFASSVHFDSQLITLDLAIILRISLLMIGRLFMAFLFANILFIFFKGKSENLLYQIIYPFRFVALFALAVVLLPRFWEVPSAWYYLSTFLLISVGPFVFSLLTQWGVKGYKNKIRAYIGNRRNTDDLTNRFLDRRPYHEKVTIIVLFQLVSFAMLSGTCEEIGGPNSIVLSNSKPALLLLRRYGDVMIFAEYDSKTQVLSRVFHFVKAGEMPDSSYHSITLPVLSRQ